MRVFRAFLFLTVFSTVLFGSGATIKLSGNQDPDCVAPEICITNDSFDITTNSSGGGYFQAVNEQSIAITELDFDLDYVDPTCTPGGSASPVTLDLDPTFYEQYATTSLSFSSNETCTAQDGVGDYQLDLVFTPGILNSFLFSIDLNSDGSTNPDDPGGWLPNTESPVYAAPEPATWASGAGLLLLAFGIYRRRRSLIARA
jgi:hypothetical protein